MTAHLTNEQIEQLLTRVAQQVPRRSRWRNENTGDVYVVTGLRVAAGALGRLLLGDGPEAQVLVDYEATYHHPGGPRPHVTPLPFTRPARQFIENLEWKMLPPVTEADVKRPSKKSLSEPGVVAGIDPGVRQLVVELNGVGIHTTDSGDGVSKFIEGGPFAYGDGADCIPWAHVIAMTTPEAMIRDVNNARRVLPVDWTIEVSYAEADGVMAMMMFAPHGDDDIVAIDREIADVEEIARLRRRVDELLTDNTRLELARREATLDAEAARRSLRIVERCLVDEAPPVPAPPVPEPTRDEWRFEMERRRVQLVREAAELPTTESYTGAIASGRIPDPKEGPFVVRVWDVGAHGVERFSFVGPDGVGATNDLFQGRHPHTRSFQIFALRKRSARDFSTIEEAQKWACEQANADCCTPMSGAEAELWFDWARKQVLS